MTTTTRPITDDVARDGAPDDLAPDDAVLAEMARAEALAGRLLAAFTAGSELLTVELGRRLGLYAHLASAGETTAAQLAHGARIPVRYARECRGLGGARRAALSRRPGQRPGGRGPEMRACRPACTLDGLPTGRTGHS